MAPRIHRLGSAAIGSVLLVTLAACPGSMDRASETCGRYADAYAERLVRCTVGAPALGDARARLIGLCERASAAPGSPPDLAAKLTTCAEANRERGCAASVQCERVVGTLEDGAPCADGYQCKTGACAHPQGSSCGTCAPPAPVGARCRRDECAPGATCELSADGEGTCVLAAAVARAGETCRSDRGVVRCDDGLVCSTDADFTCQPLGREGATCSSGVECADGLRCASRVCAPRLTEGAACTTNGDCAAGLGCDVAARTCRTPTAAQLGEPCDHGTRLCASGSCEGAVYQSDRAVTAGTCVEPLPEGAACNLSGSRRCAIDAECVAGACTTYDPLACR